MSSLTLLTPVLREIVRPSSSSYMWGILGSCVALFLLSIFLGSVMFPDASQNPWVRTIFFVILGGKVFTISAGILRFVFGVGTGVQIVAMGVIWGTCLLVGILGDIYGLFS